MATITLHAKQKKRWRFSNDLLRFRVSCFSLQDALLTVFCLAYVEIHTKGEIFPKEYVCQNCFLYKKRILVISCQYNML